MKILYTFLIIGFVIFTLYDCSEIKSEPTDKVTIKNLPHYIEAFEDSLQFRLLSEKIPGAAIAIVRDSSVVYMNTFGFAENGKGQTIDTNTVFRLASLSKGFSAILTGILVDQGLLNWDDKVIKHYPDFALKDTAQTQRVQVRHLLSHSTGLPYHAYTNLIEDGLTLKKIIPRLGKLDLIAREGEVYAYQNAGFAIIEKVLESAADTSFSSLLKNKIFESANMKNASASYEDLINSENFAKPHFFSRHEEKYLARKNSKKYYNAISAGGINAYISDMTSWMQLLLGNRQDIISDSTLNYIFSPVIKVNTRRYSRRWETRRSDYAMGWRVVNFQGRNIAFHGGYVNAYRSEIAIDRKNKLAICVLFNAPNRYASRIIPEFFKAFFVSDSNLFTSFKN